MTKTITLLIHGNGKASANVDGTFRHYELDSLLQWVKEEDFRQSLREEYR